MQIITTDQIDAGKVEIIRRFDENVRGKRADSSMANSRHDGKDGHWLERQMGISANRDNNPDLFGYEMKNQTTSKTTFGDWSANYYIYKDKSTGINRNDFLTIFGKPNMDKGGRYSWSGEPCPKTNRVNRFGQTLVVDNKSNIIVLYYFSKDARVNKEDIVPLRFQLEDLILAQWNENSIRQKLERKFNQKGWFKCLKDRDGVYLSIVFGNPIDFENWIALVKTGDVFFDSGMYQGNSRNYSQWRANNRFWDSLITSRY
jgi:hypothetical protein